jgi:hypothetical protein
MAGPMEEASDGYALENWNLSRRAEAQGAKGKVLPKTVHAGVVAPDFNQHPPSIVQIPIYQLETLNI